MVTPRAVVWVAKAPAVAPLCYCFESSRNSVLGKTKNRARPRSQRTRCVALGHVVSERLVGNKRPATSQGLLLFTWQHRVCPCHVTPCSACACATVSGTSRYRPRGRATRPPLPPATETAREALIAARRATCGGCKARTGRGIRVFLRHRVSPRRFRMG